MPNDDGLKEFIDNRFDHPVRDWLCELLDAREKIAEMQHGMKFYVERNIELTEAACDAKKTLEYWVTQAGLAEAKVRELEKCYADALEDCTALRDQLREKEEDLSYVCEASVHILKEMLEKK